MAVEGGGNREVTQVWSGAGYLVEFLASLELSGGECYVQGEKDRASRKVVARLRLNPDPRHDGCIINTVGVVSGVPPGARKVLGTGRPI